MQERISTDTELEHDNGHVAIRIGCHYGPVVQEQRDIFGSAVHTANRMTSQAKAKQIITTLATVAAAVARVAVHHASDRHRHRAR